MLAQAPSFQNYMKRRHAALGDGNPEPVSNQIDLYNDKTFYKSFIKDALEAKQEVIIYSPFVSKFRTDFLKPTIEKLREKNIEVFIFTRPIETYDSMLQDQIRVALERYEEMGVCINFLPGYIHEKVAIIDRQILWEGSLNILSQKASREMMRRIPNGNEALQIISYLNLSNKLAEGYRLRYEKLCSKLIVNSQHNLKFKILIFLSGLAIPITVWLLYSLYQCVVSSQLVKLILTMQVSH